MGKQWVRVFSLERRDAPPNPLQGWREKGLLLSGLLSLLQRSQKVCCDFQGEQAVRVRTCPAKQDLLSQCRAQLSSSLCQAILPPISHLSLTSCVLFF